MSDESRSETNRALEQRALRNTRALVDMLETDEATRRRRQKRALWILGGSAVVPIVVLVVWALNVPKASLAEKPLRDCEIDAWSARVGEVTERIRAANPGMDYSEIARLLKQEQDAFLQNSKDACRGAPARTDR